MTRGGTQGRTLALGAANNPLCVNKRVMHKERDYGSDLFEMWKEIGAGREPPGDQKHGDVEGDGLCVLSHDLLHRLPRPFTWGLPEVRIARAAGILRLGEGDLIASSSLCAHVESSRCFTGTILKEKFV